MAHAEKNCPWDGKNEEQEKRGLSVQYYCHRKETFARRSVIDIDGGIAWNEAKRLASKAIWRTAADIFIQRQKVSPRCLTFKYLYSQCMKQSRKDRSLILLSGFLCYPE